MKNSKIHEGLPQSDLRDFLSLSLVKNYDKECRNKKIDPPYDPLNEDIFSWLIKDCENYIIHYNKKLHILKEKQAIITLINIQGWKEFDVSDETEKDLEYLLRMSFIGTQSEYDTLYSHLNLDK